VIEETVSRETDLSETLFRKFASKSSFEIASSALVSVSIAVVAASEEERDE